jgi:hypothetical protein
MVSRALNLILRGLQFLFILIVLALIGAMIAQASSGNPATVNYNMFVAVFAMLSLFYLIPATWNDSFTGHPIIPLALDALNTLFIFAGATALAAGLGVHSCSNGVSIEPQTAQTSANKRRAIREATTSPTELAILLAVVARLRQLLPSCTSPSRSSPSQPSSAFSAAVDPASTCALPVSGKVDPPCPRSK